MTRRLATKKKVPPKREVKVTNEFVTGGLKVIFINDKDCNFLPIISINSSPFEISSHLRPTYKNLLAELELSINYFNIKIGRWEPFIEKFKFHASVDQDLDSGFQATNIEFKECFNINITDKLIENLYDSRRAWQGCL